MVKLPKGVKVYAGAKVYRDEIPDGILHKDSKFREKSKVVTNGGKHKGTGRD